MAIIGKIRSKMGVMLVVIVGIALFAFILGDLFSSAGFWMMGDKLVVGEMNGVKIKIDEFDNKVRQKENLYMQINNLSSIDQTVRTQIVDEVWQEYITAYVNEKEFGKLGLTVGEAELADLLSGKFVHPFIQQNFTNQETGQFDRSLVQNYLNNTIMADEASIPEENLAQWKLNRQRWAQVETMLENDRKTSKYMNLISKGLNITSKEIASAASENTDKVQIRYIFKSFNEIPDSTVQVNDADLKKAYEENKYRFRMDFAMRGIKYAVFEVLPTKEDTVAKFADINKLAAEFETSTDDTAFVYQNSDTQNDPAFLRKDRLSKRLDSLLFNASNGTMYGPYYEGGAYYLAKKIGEKTSSDSSKIKVVLIARRGNDGKDKPAAKTMADSLYGAAKSGVPIEFLAVKHSEDPTTAKDSGSIGWVSEPVGKNPLLDTAWQSQVGEIRFVTLPDAYAIMKVTERTAPVKKVKIAFVNRIVEPSTETENRIFSEASEFATANKTSDDFENAAKTGKYVIREDMGIRDNAKSVSGIEDSKKIVKWAFESELGAVSPIEKYGNKYIVALLTKKREPGVPSFDEVKKDMEPFAKRNKKAEQFIEQFKSNSGKDIDAMAGAMKLVVQSAADLAFSSYGVPGAGYEPAVIGTAFGASQGKLLGPIKGNFGVFMVIVDALNKGQAQPNDTEMMKMQMSMMLSQRAQGEATESLKSYAKVRDYRYRFDY